MGNIPFFYHHKPLDALFIDRKGDVWAMGITFIASAILLSTSSIDYMGYSIYHGFALHQGKYQEGPFFIEKIKLFNDLFHWIKILS
jgi:hypothetical protein